MRVYNFFFLVERLGTVLRRGGFCTLKNVFLRVPMEFLGKKIDCN